MLLGAAIASLQDETAVEDILAALNDLALMARVRAAAEAAGLPLCEFASATVGAFLDRARDEDWLALMTAANRTPDPATACLRVMLEFGLSSEVPASYPQGNSVFAT
jgi:HEAT repeat protein